MSEEKKLDSQIEKKFKEAEKESEKKSRRAERLAKAAEMAAFGAHMAGQGDLADFLHLGSDAAELKGAHPGEKSKVLSNLAGKRAEKFAQGKGLERKLYDKAASKGKVPGVGKMSAGKSAALGGAIAGALSTEGGIGAKTVGAVRGAANWWFTGLLIGSLFTVVGFIPILIILDFYYLLSKIDSNGKVITGLNFIPKLILAFANLLALFFIGFIIVVLYSLCNNNVEWVTSRIPGLESVCTVLNTANYKTTSFSSFGGGDSGGGGASDNWGNGACAPALSGPASVASLQSTCFGYNAPYASAIANAESGGNPASESRTDMCKDGNSFSIGLFQINMIANGGKISNSCSKDNVFTINGSGTQGSCVQRNSSGVCLKYDCAVKDLALYNLCKNMLKDSATNINIACQIYNNRQNWSAWGANNICKF